MSWHVLKVTLAHIRPPIWRRLRVPSDFTLADLHEVLQIAFGWEHCHLREFRVGSERYGIPDSDDPTAPLDDATVTIARTLPRKGARSEYIYDFGDYWTHNISVERIETDEPARGPQRWRSRGSSAPLACLDGKRAAPPEDCGGPHGYGELLKVLADRDHPQHTELTEWAGGDFDPEAISMSAINGRLAAFAR